MTGRAALSLAMSAVIIGGCSGGGAGPAAPAAGGPALAVPPALSVNAVMVGLVDHAGHALWDVEKEGGAPKTDVAWQDLEHHAMQITAAGTLVGLGGTGPADPGWASLPDWKKYSGQLTSAGSSALTAARAKNMDALVKANGQLVEVCEACHKQFKPELPTEGLMHPHHAQ